MCLCIKPLKAMTETEQNELREKIVKGIALAYERPAEQKKREDGELVFEKGGKVVAVKARDLPEAARVQVVSENDKLI
jgi:hypothetical protein